VWNKSIEKVNQLINKEIKYISRFSSYNIKNFFDHSLLYSKGILVFINFSFDKLSSFNNTIKGTIRNNNHNNSNNSEIFIDKLINLMTGIEILGLGINFHNFSVDFFKNLITNRSKIDRYRKKYTSELLFGDIFYCRAIIYLLKCGDFSILDAILETLKTVNYNKLLLSDRMVELLQGKLSFENLIIEDINSLMEINSLFKTSLMFGIDLFFNGSKRSNYNYLLGIISKLVLLKSYKDLIDFSKTLPCFNDNIYGINFLIQQKNFAKDKLINILSSLKPDWLADNFRLILNDL